MGIPTDWLATKLKKIDNTAGDIDALSKRLAFIRTWTYVAQHKDWVADTAHWRGETLAIENRLSDALHAALTQRFVDRRTSVLLRRLKLKEALVADVNENGEVTVEGQFIGKLEGFRFQLDPSASADEAKTLRATAIAALAPAFNLRSDKFYNAPDTEMDITEQGGLMWGEFAVGKLVAGDDALVPKLEAFVDDEAGTDVAEKVRRRLSHFVERRIAAQFAPLLALKNDETLTGMARGVAFRIVESMGVLPRSEVFQEIKDLDQDQRGLLRKHGVRFGQFTIFQQLMLKPAPTRLRLVLCSIIKGLAEFPEAPPPGLVTVPALKDAPKGYYAHAGYRLAGERAIRIDMLERLADMIRTQDTRAGFEGNADMLSITGLTLEQFANLMQGLGYKGTRGERPKVKAAPASDDPGPDDPEPDAKTQTPEVVADDAAQKPAPEVSEAKAEVVPEVEVFYTFVWVPRRKPQPQNDARKGKPKGKPRAKGKPGPSQKTFAARPPKPDKPIDPDNPFAALMALKGS